MPDDHFSSVRRRLAEAEADLAAAHSALRVAGEQGRTHLLSTLHTLIEARAAEVAALRAKLEQHRT